MNVIPPDRGGDTPDEEALVKVFFALFWWNCGIP